MVATMFAYYVKVFEHRGEIGAFGWQLSAEYTRISYGFKAKSASYTNTDSHNGIDLPAPEGTPIYAAADGVVTVSEAHYSYGNHVVIDHGNGLTTLYAHMKSVNVTVGQKVSRGQEIGRGGSTGWSTGPHLHFEVRVNGRCVNPLKYVSTSS